MPLASGQCDSLTAFDTLGYKLLHPSKLTHPSFSDRWLSNTINGFAIPTTNLDPISWDSTFIEVVVFVPVCVERSHPPTNSHHVLRSSLDQKSQNWSYIASQQKSEVRFLGEIRRWNNHQGVVFLPGDSLLHLGRSKLSEVLFQSRHEVQQSGVKTCVVERSFKPSDEVLTFGCNPNKFAQIVSLLEYSPH